MKFPDADHASLDQDSMMGPIICALDRALTNLGVVPLLNHIRGGGTGYMLNGPAELDLGYRRGVATVLKALCDHPERMTDHIRPWAGVPRLDDDAVDRFTKKLRESGSQHVPPLSRGTG
jgi:hypothetical protein